MDSDLKKESAIRAITPIDQKFFLKNLNRWEKYFNMEHYIEGGGGICWNKEALQMASLDELLDILSALSMYRSKKENSLLLRLRRLLKKKTSS